MNGAAGAESDSEDAVCTYEQCSRRSIRGVWQGVSFCQSYIPAHLRLLRRFTSPDSQSDVDIRRGFGVNVTQEHARCREGAATAHLLVGRLLLS
jgi:hypothetical protein